MTSSENDYDWLGKGIYFWEDAPIRARDWAARKFGEADAAVLGAKIRLGHCLDLVDMDSYVILRQAYQALSDAGEKLPQNERKLHKLDCFVVNAAVLRAAEEFNDPYDTVRCPFIEGSPVFPNSNFFDLTHIQIAVRNPEAIISLFPISF